MKANDRARLTASLRDHVAKIAADLRAKMRARGPARVAAEQLHKDERVAEDFDVWTDLLSRRAAVLWVLKSVYVRVLEDRGLLAPGRLLDPEAQQLFEKLAPNLGETAFLRWIYRDLASKRGGVPELFSQQPAEVALPSDDLSRALIAFWRHRDADTGAVWSFAEEHFEGELMGDLYQELDPVVKDRFALCQTPDFVRAFILDRTLTPAIETFGADEVRLLDPACGSGHFLIDGLKRLVVATAEKHSDWNREKVVTHALDRVVGIDLNDYACALARTRLIMTASELAGVTKLADAARFHPHVYWADGLEQVEREEQKPSLQYALFEMVDEKPRATLTRSDVRAALRKVFANKFSVVIGNPPYINESDEKRKAYHREKVGRALRYVAAYREYSLVGPFIERAFQLGVPGAFVGFIVGNSFMKARFGAPTIEKVLASRNLVQVVDTSFAKIPAHDTPTAILLATNAAPTKAPVTVVMGKRGDSAVALPGDGDAAWRSISSHAEAAGFENEFVAVMSVDRTRLAKWPWALSGGATSVDLRARIEAGGKRSLAEFLEQAGAVVVTRADPIYVAPRGVLERRVPESDRMDYVAGDSIRDWTLASGETAIFPYDSALTPRLSPAVEAWLRPYRVLLERRVAFGKTQLEHGKQWFEYSMLFGERLRTPRIAFSDLASHNHFVVQDDSTLNNSHAPVLILKREVSEDVLYALLGILSSSVACFWLKQVFKPKSSASDRLDKAGFAPENDRYEFGTTGLKKFPVPENFDDERLIKLSRELTDAGRQRESVAPAVVLRNRENLINGVSLASAFARASASDEALFHRLVFLQEELDWLVYELFGLASYAPAGGAAQSNAVPVSRPCAAATLDALLDDGSYRERWKATQASPSLRLLETAMFKRPWHGRQGVFGRYDRTYKEKARTALLEWLASRLEQCLSAKPRLLSVEQICADIQDDPEAQSVCEVLTARRDFDLASLCNDVLRNRTVPNHPIHIYTESGLAVRSAWERVWSEVGGVDASQDVALQEYRSVDFVGAVFWRIRGRWDVPSERFIRLDEAPWDFGPPLFMWSGWSPVTRIKMLLKLDEELEDAGLSTGQRIGVLDSGWRLLGPASEEDAAAATRLKAELQALVGPEGPSRQLIEGWKKRSPPPTTRASRARKAATARDDEDSETEESDVQ